MGQRHLIQGPDGVKHVIEAPDGATSEQIIAFAEKSFGQKQPQPEDQGAPPSQIESFGRGMLQSGSLGTADEIYAGAKALWNNLGVGAPQGDIRHMQPSPEETQKLSDDYESELGGVRAANARAQEVNPGVYFGGQVAGGFATAPVLPAVRGATVAGDIGAGVFTGAGYGGAAGFASGEGGLQNRIVSAAQGLASGGAAGGAITAGFRGARAVRRAYANQGEAGAYGTIADDLPNGVDQFANEVAAGPSRANVATNRRTLDVLGEEMQRAGGDVALAQQATIARIVQEQNVTPQTAAAQIRRLTAVHEDSPLMLAEYPAVSGSDAAQRLRQPGNINLDELGRTQDSTTQGTLDYLANNGNAQSASDVRNALSARQETLAPAMREMLESVGPQVQTGPRATRPANIVDTSNMVEAARQLGHLDYQRAYNAPINNHVSLHVLPRLLQRYQYEAAGRSGDAADAMRRASDQFFITTPNGQRVAMNTLQQLQDARGALRGQMTAYARQGRNDLAGVVRPMYQRITRLMETMSPQWAVANRRWAGMKFEEVAQDLGDAFSTRAGPQFREQVAQFQGMAPQAQNIVRVHVLQKLFDKLDNLPDTHSVSKLFANDQARTLIRTLFGDDAVVGFTRAVRDQRVAEASRSMTQNSATHRRGVAQRQKDAETGLVAAVEGANARGVKNWLIERLTQVLTERRNRPMADILTTPINDTANVARHIHNMLTQQNILQRLDQPSRMQVPATVSGSVAASEYVAQKRNGPSSSVQKTEKKTFPPPMHLGGPKPYEPDPSNPDDPMWIPGSEEGKAFWKEREATANKESKRNALVTYGDNVLIPGAVEIGSNALYGIRNAGDAMLAFGPMGEALSGPMNALAGFAGAMRGNARAAVAAAGAGERILSKPTAEQVLKRLQSENDTLIREGQAYGIRPGDMPDMPLSAEEQSNMLSSVNDAMRSRIDATKTRLDGVNASAPKSSVPSVDGYTPMAERADVAEWLAKNPYTQAVKGRQGFPTKKEQADLAKSFFDRGGRLPEAGPWGRDMRASVQHAIEHANRVEGRTGLPEAKFPSVSDITAAWKGARDEAAALSKEIAELRKEATPQAVEIMSKRLAELTKELESLRAAKASVDRRSESFRRLYEANKPAELPPPESSQAKPPRIYRRDAE